MLVVASSDGVKLSDGPGAWRTELGGHGIDAVVPDGTTLWALVDGHQVWQRFPEGGWALASSSDERLTCLAPATPGGPLLGTAGAFLGRIDGAGHIDAFPEFAHAPTREQWYTPSGGPPDVRSLAVAGDGTWFVNVHVGGILRSSDGGASWSATLDLHADVHQVICPRPYQPGLVLAACADGLAISRDSGTSWRLRDEGLPTPYSRAVAVAGDTVLMSASSGPRGGNAGLYRAPLDGWGRFQRCRGGLPEDLGGNIDTRWLAVGGGEAALVSALGDVYASSDEGVSWVLVGQGLVGPAGLSWA
ncbi:MAG: WD40/YVTN/BNR-like repeat-containing protein [Acidimicrobiales bacterium]